MTEGFTYRGYGIQDLKNMDLSKFMEIVPSRIRRSLKRGFTPAQKILLKRIEAERIRIEKGAEPKPIRTHCRDMVILPNMVGLIISVHNGKEFVDVRINAEKLGHVLGEFTYNRKRVNHNNPGVGATKGSAFVSVK